MQIQPQITQAPSKPTQALSNQAQALSKHDSFAFLKGPSNAGEFQTPLEEASKQIKSFASFHTGTQELRITPEIQNCVSELRQMSLSTEFKKLARFIQILQRDFPSHNGRLTQLVNPAGLATHVPFCETPEDVTEDQLRRSLWSVEMQSDHALVNGVPIWDRFEGERFDFFVLFKLYRDARYGLIDSGDYVLCNRSMAGLANKLALPPLLVNTIAHIYNWQTRCSYYDLFFEHEIARRKQLEIQLLQQDHLLAATRLLDNAMEYLDKNAAQLTPKEALNMAALGFKISRLSLGLMPEKPEMGDAPSNQPLLAIYNHSTTNNADQMVQVNNQHSYGSEVERLLHEDIKETSNLLSILDVLQRSGAMGTAINGELTKDVTDSVVEDATNSVNNVESIPPMPIAFSEEAI